MHSRLIKLRDKIAVDQSITDKETLTNALDVILNSELITKKNLEGLIRLFQTNADKYDYLKRKETTSLENITDTPTIYYAITALIDTRVDILREKLKKLDEGNLGYRCLEIGLGTKKDFWQLPEISPMNGDKNHLIEALLHIYRLKLLTGLKKLNKLPEAI